MNDHYSTDELIDYLHGELGEERDAHIYAHLAVCAPCQAAFEAESQLTDYVRSAARAEELELPPMVKARVWEAVRAARPSWIMSLRQALRPAIAVPAAALLAAGVYFAVPVARSHATHPEVAASFYFDAYAAASQETPLADRSASSASFITSERSNEAAPTADAVSAATLDDSASQ